jgi:hypothetical protein
MTKLRLAAHWTSAATAGGGDIPQSYEEPKAGEKNTDNNTASRGRGNSEVERQLENEPTRDVATMEISRTTRME